ncbi:MAG: family 10 glycosylhydrolase [Scytonema sp. PMC 1069.18]|nr:family 10 glycosylhydrolase [Scytonema sp. PMC 1069.18]MEC4882796.1 family 10 glycosylhydrolase [Scytonema sp. PMC 1070.18]
MTRFIHRKFNHFIYLGLILSFIVFSTPFSSVSPQNVNPLTQQEIRGVWLSNVSSGVLFVPWGINRALNQLSAYNFNTVYPVVWNRGYTFYKSEIAQRETGFDTQPLLNLLRGGNDVLATIAQLSARKNLRVIPWFEYGFMLPPNSILARVHPDWLTTQSSGVNWTEETTVDLETGHSHSKPITRKEVWLNPFHPLVQNFIKGLILEVVTKYNVDGIQLDDHFGIPVRLGYDSFTVQLYQQEHNGKKPPIDPFNPEWMRWRADKLTNFIQDIVQSVKAVNPNAQLSLSPNSQAFSYKHYLQDWENWVNKGLVDELILQVYRNDKKSFLDELKQTAIQNVRRKIPVSVGILTGTLTNPVDIQRVREQVRLVREQSFDGFSFFYWESLWSYMTPDAPKKRRKAFLEMFALTKAK